MASLQAGVGRADITPPVGIEMGAWVLRTGLAEGVHDRMLARALVLDDGATPLAIAAIDVANISTERADLVRRLVAEQTPIPAENILLNCSHTHTTPLTGRSIGDRRGTTLTPGHSAYLDSFPYYVAGAIIEAWHHRVPARIGSASVAIPGVSTNRRDPALPVDPEAGVIRVDDAAGRPIACMVNYACHGTSVGAHYLEWTADFAGFLTRAIEAAQPGCSCMFLQGAEGDIHPWDWYFGNPNPRYDDHYDGSERLGKAIAGPAFGAFQKIETQAQAEIRVATSSIDLPPRPIRWTAEEAEAHYAKVAANVEPPTSKVIPDNCPGCMSAQRFPDLYRMTGARHEALFARDYPTAGIPCALTVARIGDFVLAANPGELFSQPGMDIKRGSPVAKTYVLSLTNGSVMYIPAREPAEAVLSLPLEEFTDPVKYRRHYGATITTEIGPGGADMLVAETLRLIDQVR